MTTTNNIMHQLAAAIQECGLTQQKIASAAGTLQAVISDLAREKYPSKPSVDLIERVAAACGYKYEQRLKKIRKMVVGKEKRK
jgi:transcriptional regulator with XRE-family HTH domain